MNPPAQAVSDMVTVPGYTSDPVLVTRSGPDAPGISGIHVQQGSPAQAYDARRILNVVLSAIAILLTAPLMLVIAALIKLTSTGPVLYRQTRVGLDRRHPGDLVDWSGRRRVDYGGRLFTMYKFRTMHATPDDREVWAARNDDRITSVGRVLRKFRLDELPQLFNVLKGDMNLVGPRPEQPTIFQTLREEIDHYADRQRILPGITGWAQIHQGYDTCIDDVRRKVDFDLEYIRAASVRRDLWILAMTIPVMLFGKGGP